MADDDRDDTDTDTDADVESTDVEPADVEPADVAEPGSGEPERVTPEVVADAPPADAPPPIPGPTEKVVLYRMVRIGLAALMMAGALIVLVGVVSAVNPEDGVCDQARTVISDELDRDEDERDPAVDDIDPEVVDDLPCPEAVPLAQDLDDDLASESDVRTAGTIAAAMGALIIAAAVAALFLRTRRGRSYAMVGAALGFIQAFTPLGIILLPLLGLAVYGIYFSRDAKASYGDPRAGRPAAGGGLFRPRVPPPPKD